MGLNEKYVEFFNACSKFRVYGFDAFIGTLFTFSFGWILALALCFKGEMKWWVAMPAILIGMVGLLHYREILFLATTLIYSPS